MPFSFSHESNYSAHPWHLVTAMECSAQIGKLHGEHDSLVL